MASRCNNLNQETNGLIYHKNNLRKTKNDSHEQTTTELQALDQEHTEECGGVLHVRFIMTRYFV